MRTIKEALEDGSLSLEDEIDYDDTPQGEEIACLKLEIERLNNIINEIRRLLKEEYYQDIAVGKILRMIDKDSGKE